MTLTVSAAEVRDYLQLEPNNPTGNSTLSDGQIESNILAAQETLERATRRWFVARPAVTYTATTMLRAIVPIPGFNAFTSVTAYGSVLTVNQAVWPLPDAQNTGVYTSLQFRPFRGDIHEWHLANPQWWDAALDNPFYPGNYGGGYAWTSMPNDLVVVGDGGYTAGTYPFAWLLAVKQLAAFFTKQPASILAETIITPQGGVINYAQLPSTVQAFITSWQAGQTVVSVG
ncbi:MAG TPA: hypothetical protein VIU37_00580 [Candidatus Limnocylindrales bacterium]